MTELLADHTTLRLGGPASSWVRATTTDEMVAAVSDTSGHVLILGGGSNMVVSDAGFKGTVVEVATTGVHADYEGDPDPTYGTVLVTVAAGESWDDLVVRALEHGWVGIEALAGIPGQVGATPIQNVGAYGQDVAQTIVRVQVWDRARGAIRTMTSAECQFGYRTSRFKVAHRRFVVLAVTFRFQTGTLSGAVTHAELANALGIKTDGRAPLVDVREVVLALRRRKGMVLDPTDHDTWSVGSFFVNPVIDAAEVPPDAPARPEPDGRVSTSAAWLIERAGFPKGYGHGPVSLSTKHSLALTNRGGARTDDLLELAREVRDGVERTHGIRLTNEPVLVGCTL
ncbi:MAG: UDP-N-acetylmuramate dehydrogenase [Actinomycetales bacterium]|jgi:UDP-N-acetylmuramate dehydrogenase|uniref:UDP-N-acetylenolpyruvoylglucosamine reductase n=1 Tax=Candidatus Phosphoribacter hodrii TaxID=2953743 RepID=A0A9D7XVS7_9MICO|nr:UDP-N-acetylmuramate dehydrogenase [Candidatus Phosphoribacter hodrii]